MTSIKASPNWRWAAWPGQRYTKEFLQIIQTNAERMITIINDLLDITKIETGSVELDLRPLHLAESLS